jgi:O-antigen/teichoic acid export membrane protein
MNRSGTGSHPSLMMASATYLLSNVLTAAIPFALLPILTRYLQPSEYGQVAMFQAMLSGLIAVVGLNAHAAADRKFFDNGLSALDLKQFIGSCLQLLFASGLLMLWITYSLREYLTDWLGLGAKWQLWAVFVATGTLVVQLRLGQWQVASRPRPYAALQVLSGTLNVLFALALVVVLPYGAEGRIASQIAATGLVMLLALILLARDGLLALFVWRPAYVREALEFGVPLIPHTFGIFMVASLDRVVITSHLGLATAGIYMVAVQLASALSLVFDAVNKAYVPWLYERLRRNDIGEKRQIVRYTYGWFLAILAGAASVFVISADVIRLLAGDKYQTAADFIGWLALGHAFGGMYLMVTNYIFYSKRTGLLSLVTLAAAGVNIILLIILIPLWGAKGAAMAFACAMFVRFLLTWLVASQKCPMPWLVTLLPQHGT